MQPDLAIATRPPQARAAFFILLLALSLLLPFLPTASSAATLDEIRQRGVIRVAVADERPYGYLNADGEALGAGPSVARHLLETLGIDNIEWVETTFKDLIPGLEEGRFDMAAAEMAILPDRCQRVLFSDPNTSYGEGLLVRASNPRQIHAYEAFAERTDDIVVAVQAGAVQQSMLAAMGVAPGRILAVTTQQEAIQALLDDRADAFAATGLTVAQMERLDEGVEAEFNFEDPVIDGQEVRYWGGFAFPQDAADLRDAVDDALAEFKQDDEWEQILTRYGFLKKDILYSYRFSAERLCQPQG